MSALPEDKRREEMLRELGLLPVWRQRVPLPTDGTALALAQDSTDSPVPAPQAVVAASVAPAPAAPAQIDEQVNAEVAEQAAAQDGLNPEPAAVEALSSQDWAAEADALESVAHQDSEISLAELAVSAAAELEVAEPEAAGLEVAESESSALETSAAASALAPAAELIAPASAPASTTQTENLSDDHAAEREYYAASPSAWMEYAESVEPDWYTQEELAAATPDRRAQIMGMAWQALQESVTGCQACQLHSTRTQTVFGVGDPQAEWLFVGEAPGSEEDKRGEPFVGQAGKLLDNMLAAIQLKRGENVYIANVLKCRPPANRDPQGEEVQQCDPYLKRQVELIQPKLIVALGKFAAQSLLQSQGSIASLRGGLHDFHGVPVIVTYHPAYLLRNLPDKARAWEDLCFARETMRGLQLQQATPS